MNAFAEPEPTPALVADINNILDTLDTDELAAFIYRNAANPGIALEALGVFFPHLHLTVEGER
ncbi:hypothetical protein [Streptomyces sp. NPDC048611]|uniref:hypothetical protein n=1 Tax=Streptomyces sp. NPDC048611 TaxID=3155635 RepID=UPI003434C203